MQHHQKLDMSDQIKKEVYDYVLSLNLSQDELKIIDTYISEMITSFSPVLDAQKIILEDKKKRDSFKKLILDSIKEL